MALQLLALRDRDLLWRKVEDEVVVLDLRLSTYFTLNGSGTLLWERLADSATPDELCDVLVEAYGVSRQRAVSDVEAFLQSLHARELVLTEAATVLDQEGRMP